MEQFNFWMAIALGVFTLIVVKIALIFVKSFIEKLYIIFLSMFTYIYCGIGIAFDVVDKKFIFSYITFIALILVGLLLGFRIVKSKKKSNIIESLTKKNSWVIYSCFILYWVILMSKLYYPVNRVEYIFDINIQIKDVFENQIYNRSNTMVYFLGIIMLVLRPFYFIFLYKMKSILASTTLLVLELYLGIVINGYIGRSGLIVNILMIVFIFVYKKSNKINFLKNNKILFKYGNKILNIGHKMNPTEIKEEYIYKKFKKIFLLIVIIVFFMLPMLFDYQNFRLGASTLEISPVEKIERLAEIEFSFPKLYDEASDYSKYVHPQNYFNWFFTLVIPKKILDIGDVMLLNYDFSTYITEIEYGTKGFSVYLPSILGEGIILYGDKFACIHGLFLGIVTGLFCSIFRKSDNLSLWNLFILFQVIFMPRGGSQGTLSMYVNGSLLLIIFMIFGKIKNLKVNYK